MTDSDFDDEWEAGFDEACDKAKRDRDLASGVYQAEVARLALLPPDLEYQIERKPAAKRLGIPVTALDRMVKARRPEKAAKKSAVPAFDPAGLQASAGHIIQHPDILTLFAQEFSKVVAGEAINGKLLYLVATSRLFDKPMSAAVKGTSAVGKSEIRKRILEFFPPEDVVSFTSLSEKSLLYHEGDFTHKILSMGEAVETDQQNFQNYLLRELISEGCLRHNTVRKIGNEIVAATIEKRGPVTFLVTTTKNKLHPENETRMLSIEMDDSENQTRRVLDKVAQIVGMGDTASVDYKPWQEFQRWLATGERRVVVPFAGAISDLIPKVAVRLRRDFPQVLCAIKAHALLHRDRRDRDEAGRIVADIERDYAIVRELTNAIVAEGSGVAVNKAMAETIDAVTKATIGMTEAEGVSALEIGHLLKLDKSAAWRRLSAARSEGFIVNLEQRKGMPGKYRATGHKVEPVNILPTVTDLTDHFSSLAVSPPKTAEPCNRDGIAEDFQADNGCKPDLQPVATDAPDATGDNPLATGLATDNALNGNEELPPVARLHGFPGGTHTRAHASLDGPWLDGDWPLVCEHCGEPDLIGATIQPVWVEGERHYLHPHCRQGWLAADESVGASHTD
jgi:hypothetical protein